MAADEGDIGGTGGYVRYVQVTFHEGERAGQSVVVPVEPDDDPHTVKLGALDTLALMDTARDASDVGWWLKALTSYGVFRTMTEVVHNSILEGLTLDPDDRSEPERRRELGQMRGRIGRIIRDVIRADEWRRAFAQSVATHTTAWAVMELDNRLKVEGKQRSDLTQEEFDQRFHQIWRQEEWLIGAIERCFWNEVTPLTQHLGELIAAELKKLPGESPIDAGIERIAREGVSVTEIKRPGSLIVPAVETGRMSVARSVQLLFQLIGLKKERDILKPYLDHEQAGLCFPAKPKDENTVRLVPTQKLPPELRNRHEAAGLENWLWGELSDDLELMDEMLWDMAVVSLVTYFDRTDGANIETRFPLLFDDYFDWRDVDPRHRTPDAKKELLRRFRLLCSGVRLETEVTIHVRDPKTGRSKPEQRPCKGPFLVWAGDLYGKRGDRLTTAGEGIPDGLLVSLGEWSRDLMANGALVGHALRKLAQYNPHKQLWERRIGAYLVFQMHNQATHAQWRTVNGTLRMVKPQQPLYLETILDGACIDWRDRAKKDPQRVLTQAVNAIEQLTADGLIQLRQIDGPLDGLDLKPRGRLEAVKKRRFEALPGRVLEEPLSRKVQKALDAKAAAAKARSERQRKEGNQSGAEA